MRKPLDKHRRPAQSQSIWTGIGFDRQKTAGAAGTLKIEQFVADAMGLAEAEQAEKEAIAEAQ